MDNKQRPPFAQRLAALTEPQRDELKALLGPRTAGYLRHIAAGHRNASARTAMRIVEAWAKVPGLAPLHVGEVCRALAHLVPAQDSEAGQ